MRKLFCLWLVIFLFNCGGGRSGAIKGDSPLNDHADVKEVNNRKSKKDYPSTKNKYSSEKPAGGMGGGGEDISVPEKIKIIRPSSSGLKASYVDDNLQYNRFLNFLKKFKNQTKHYSFKVKEKIILMLKDKKNKSLANADLSIFAGGELLYKGKTYADGSCLFYPSEYRKQYSKYKLVVKYNQARKEFYFTRKGKRKYIIKLPVNRSIPRNVPVDILFVFDTTGSMGEEIERLRTTIEIIYLNLSSLSIKPSVRMGMVLYKDRKDEYITKVVPFTGNLNKFQKELNEVYASGGGDTPEDLQAALHDSLKKMQWRSGGVRLAYIITDAPPHLDYKQEYTYQDAAYDARKNAIKFFTVGSGGLDINGEYVLRQLAQYTGGKYIFLTYGEKGESGGGTPGSVSHHTGTNYTSAKLETIIMKFAKKELSHLTDRPIKDAENYYTAQKISGEQKDKTLKKLFAMTINQLIDYSSVAIPKGTAAAIIPVVPFSKQKKISLNAEYFTDQLIFTLSRNKHFKMVERKSLQKILKELEFQMSGMVDPDKAAKVGKFVGAKMIISGQLYKKADYYELFVKLLNVETAEVIAVSKARIEFSLGL